MFLYNEAARRAGVTQIPLIVPGERAGGGLHGRRLRPRERQGGVCLVTSGPGATNTVTPVRDCMADSIPIVVICGQVPRAAIGTDAFQEAPVPSIMGAVAKHIFLVTDPAKLEATVRTAFEIARTGRPGPVVIDIPKDVQNWEGTFAGEGLLPIPGYRRRMRELTEAELEPAAAARFFGMLGEAERPLIYAGGGVINGNAAAALTEFAQRLRHPGRHDAHGHRRLRHHAAAGAAHAGHARGGVRQLCRR